MNEPMHREKKYQKLNAALLFIMSPAAGGCAYLAAARGDGYAASQALLALLMFTLPAFSTRILHFLIPQDVRFLYYIFVFATMVVGSAMYGYSRIPYWDKLFHFFSGILISAAGLIVCHLLFYTLSGPEKARKALYLLFTLLFNLSAAVLWEIYEYMLYILLGIDAVNTLTTGVNDTMQDMIVCLLGGILFLSSLQRAFRKGKYGFIMQVCRHFFDLREHKKEIFCFFSYNSIK